MNKKRSPQLLRSFAAAGLSNGYRAPEDRQVGLTLRNGLIIIGSGAVGNVLRELFAPIDVPRARLCKGQTVVDEEFVIVADNKPISMGCCHGKLQ